MYQLAHVTNTILYRAREEGMPITPMKLQKLIYFLYAEYLHQEGEALFAERFEPWKYGPALDDVYQAYKDYGAKPIRRYMPDVNGRQKAIDIGSDPAFRICFDKVWMKYAKHTGIELSKITHQEISAWYAAALNEKRFLRDEDIEEEMRRRYGEE